MSFTAKRLISAAPTGGLIGELVMESSSYPASGTFTVPDGVYSISVLIVDAGTNGQSGGTGTPSLAGSGGLGGTVGPVYYKNNIPVTPGASFAYQLGAASTSASVRRTRFDSMTTPPAGFTSQPIPGISSAEDGGPGSPTTFVSGFGGRSTTGINLVTPLDTPITLTGTQNPGTTTPGGTGAAGKNCLNDYGGAGGGGGGGARLDGAQGGAGGTGRRGAIRIVWPGEARQFPYDAA